MTYSGAIVNIRIDNNKVADAIAEAADRERVYEYGHRDARHAAAEIACGAEAEIEELKARLEKAGREIEDLEARQLEIYTYLKNLIDKV